ncbi:MAG TPA: S8 family serine peptidase, partial [Thermoanaerobaculia bacterium]|nr:S8 family serine peptidase [Thermoanaerobaculia bacterium]
ARVADNARIADARILSIEPFTAQKKIEAAALHEAVRGASWARLNVVFQRDVPFDDAREAILSAGAALVDPFATHYAPSHRITVKVASASLDALASDDRVFAIAGPRRFRVEADNAESAALSHVTELYSAPYNLSGAGVVVSLFELAEAQATHPEFGGRLNVHASGGTFGDKQHATHVAGTIGAAGIQPAAKGMAPSVTIHQFCVTCGQDDLEFLSLKDEQLAPLGVVADNNSWGFVLGWTTDAGLPVWTDLDRFYGAYDLVVASPLDEISIEKNILFVHSSGNDGTPPSFQTFFDHFHTDDNGDTVTSKTYCYSLNGSGTDCPANCNGGCEKTRHHDTLPFDTIGVTAAAKNVVTVGALVSTTIPPSIVPFSSRGPAKDGRVKPDLVARGFQVFSTVPTNSYARNSGTSMSSPAVTGIAAILTEQWRKTFGSSPKAAQLKALLLAGAEDLGNPGPDYTYGFGLVNAKNAVDIILADAGKGDRIRNLTIGQGQSQEISISVPQTQKLRVLLNWPDPSIPPLPNDDIAPKALVNDLDLSVIDPAGNTVRPYVLDKTKPDNAATRGVNTVDNVEEVEIANATPGTYRVRVAGTSVAQGPQSAVLVTSVGAAPPCVDIQEANDSAANAYGNLVPGQAVSAALCSQSDVDFFKFVATKTGPVSVTVKTFDTPVRVTLSGTGISMTHDIAANTTATFVAMATTVPNALTLKFEPVSGVGSDPRYTFTPTFGEAHGAKRRSVR